MIWQLSEECQFDEMGTIGTAYLLKTTQESLDSAAAAMLVFILV